MPQRDCLYRLQGVTAWLSIRRDEKRFLGVLVVRLHQGPFCRVEENAVVVFVAIEASQPDGTTYRVAMGCKLHPASWLFAFARLF